MSKKNKKLLNILCILFLLPALGFGAKENGVDKTAEENYIKKQKKERIIDSAALRLKLQSVKNLKKIYLSSKVTERKSSVLFNLIIIQKELSEIEIRIAYQTSMINKKPLDKKNFEKTLNEIIKNANIFIKEYPKTALLDEIIFIRGSTYEQLQAINYAEQDYLQVKQNYPKSKFRTNAILALGEISYNQNNFQKAIEYYSQISMLTPSESALLASYKISWSYAQRGDYESGFQYMKTHTMLIQKKMSQEVENDSEKILLVRAYTNLAQIYYKGIQNKVKNFDLKKAYTDLIAIAKGPLQGVTLFQMAKEIRVNGSGEELLYWKDITIEKTWFLPEAVSILTLTLDYFYPKDINKVAVLSKELNDLKNKIVHSSNLSALNSNQNFEKSLRKVLSISQDLQNKINKKEKENEGLTQKYLTSLVMLYESYSGLTVPNDPELGFISYNTAESYFRLKEYNIAADRYRSILNNWETYKKNNKEFDKKINFINIMDSSIRAQYNYVEKEKHIPSNLKPVKFEANKEEIALSEATKKWLVWLDGRLKLKEPLKEEMVYYQFQAGIVLYSANKFKNSFNRLEWIVKNYPEDPLSLNAISLMVDTFVLNEMWESVISKSDIFISILDKMKVSSPKKSEEIKKFSNQLHEVSSDASFTIITKNYNEKKYSETKKYIKQHMQKYNNTKNIPKVIFLSGKIEIELNNKKDALIYLEDLVKRYPTWEQTPTAILMAAKIYEEYNNFSAVSEKYSTYLKIDQKITNITKSDMKALAESYTYWHFLADKRDLLDCENTNKWRDEQAQCYFTEAMEGFIENPVGYHLKKDRKQTSKMLDTLVLFLKAYEERNSEQASLDQLTEVNERFLKIDPVYRYSINSFYLDINEAIIKNKAKKISDMSKVRMNAEDIKTKIQQITNLEKKLKIFFSSPFKNIQINALNAVISTYSMISLGLKKLGNNQPKEIVDQLDEAIKSLNSKGKKLSSKVMEISALYPIDIGNEIIAFVTPAEIPVPISVANDSILKNLNYNQKIDVSLTDEMNIETEKKEEFEEDFGLWKETLKLKQFARSVHFLNQMSSKYKLAEDKIIILNAIILSEIGLTAEAFKEIDTAFTKSEGKLKKALAAILVNHYSSKGSKESLDKIKKGLNS